MKQEQPNPSFCSLKPIGRARNIPCPCGSGLKLKKCCGSGEALSAQYKAEKDAFYAELQRRSEERAREEEQRVKQRKPRKHMTSVALMSALAAMVGTDFRSR